MASNFKGNILKCLENLIKHANCFHAVCHMCLPAKDTAAVFLRERKECEIALLRDGEGWKKTGEEEER